MITGGLGFIGSNLARQLVAAGADVLVVDALIPDYGGNTFNIDGIVTVLIDTAPTGSMRSVEWPAEKKRIAIGGFYTDSTRFRQTAGWKPRVSLRDGLQTLDFYSQHLPHYPDEPVSEGLFR